jgi:hypothetical protein
MEKEMKEVEEIYLEYEKRKKKRKKSFLRIYLKYIWNKKK